MSEPKFVIGRSVGNHTCQLAVREDGKIRSPTPEEEKIANSALREALTGDAKATKLSQVAVSEDAIHADLWYPRSENRVKAIVVGLVDVRAADDIRVTYDFDRDGWKIEQASAFQWELDDPNCGNPDWQEVAFVKAWAREVKRP